MSVHKLLHACAACGVRSIESEYKTVSIHKLDQLKLSDEGMCWYKDLDSYTALASVYEHQGTLYHLHSESVDSSTCEATLCFDCVNSIKKTTLHRFSLKVGHDYGDVSWPLQADFQLQPLTLIEKHLIVRVRLYASIIKLYQSSRSSRVLKGHVISFLHDGPEAVAAYLPDVSGTAKAFKVLFVGTNGRPEKGENTIAHKELRVRVRNVYNWLRMLKVCNPLYKDIELRNDEATRAAMEALPTQLLKDSSAITEKDSLIIDSLATDDAAKVRSGYFPEEIATCATTEGGLSHVFVSNRGDFEADTSLRTQLDDIRCTFFPGLKISLNNKENVGAAAPVHDKLTVLAARLSNTPINEFTSNDALFLNLFPHLFIFGRLGGHVEGNTGSLSRKFVRHLLLQRSNAFAQEPRFYFTAFNQYQRHAAARAISVRAIINEKKMKRLGVLATSNEFKAKVERASLDPEGLEAREVIKEFDSLIRLTGKQIDFSPGQRAAAISDLYAYCHFFQCASVFFTMAPDDTHSTLVLRLSFPTTHANEFPVRDSGLIKGLTVGVTEFSPRGGPTVHERSIDISELGLQSLLSQNPVAAAAVFKQMIEAFCEVLIGILPDYKSRSTTPLAGRKKGIFGQARAFYNCTEAQGRLSLHAHMKIWAGLTPYVLQRVTIFQSFLIEVEKVIATQFRGQISPVHHLKAMATMVTQPQHRVKREPRTCYSDCPVPSSAKAMAQLETRAQICVNLASVHQHGDCCKKGKHGAKGCRLSFQRNRTPCMPTNKVDVVHLQRDLTTDGEEPWTVKATRGPFNFIGSASGYKRNYSEQPLPIQPKQAFVYAPQRHQLAMDKDYYSLLNHASLCQEDCLSTLPSEAAPYSKEQIRDWLKVIDNLDAPTRDIVHGVLCNRNAAVVDFSPVATACLSCNTASYLLGGLAQAKAILFYLIKYICKDAVALTQTLVVIKHAREKQEKIPSAAENSGTDIRTGQYLLTIILNKLTGMTEMCDTQCAAWGLQMPAQFGSHRTTYVFARPAAAFVKANASLIDVSKTGWFPVHGFEGKLNIILKRNSSTDSSIFRASTVIPESNDDSWAPQSTSRTHTHHDSVFLDFEDALGDSGHQHLQSDKQGTPSAKIYNVAGTPVPIPMHIHYGHRGKKLEEMNFLEYSCIIEVVTKDSDDKHGSLEEFQNETVSKTKVVRRKKNARFSFGKHHPLFKTHCQMLRSKLLVPLLTGGRQPSLLCLDGEGSDFCFSSCNSSTQSKLTDAAVFFLAIMSPWVLASDDIDAATDVNKVLVPRDGMSFKAFGDFMSRLDGMNSKTCGLPAEPTFLNRCRSKYIQNVSSSLSVDKDTKNMITKFRNLATDKWADVKKDVGPCSVVEYFRQRHGSAFGGKSVNVESDEEAMLHQHEAEK
jgi:hypothetical protein